MTISPPYLKDADSNILSFPSKFYVRTESISRRSSLVQLPYSDLSKDTADGCFNPRRIDVSGILYAEDEATARALVDSIHAFSSKKDLELWYKGRRIRIDKLLESTIQDNGKRGFLYNISIGFQAGDPFWYSEEKEIIPTSNPYEFEIEGTADTFPTILVTMLGSASSLTLKLNGQTCEFNAPLYQNDILEIDSCHGTVKLNGDDAIKNFSGLFPKLNPGENTIEVSGGSGSVVINYSEAYI